MHRLWLLSIPWVLGCSSSPEGGSPPDTTDTPPQASEPPVLAISCDAPDDNLPVAYDTTLDVQEDVFEELPLAIIAPPERPTGLALYFHGSGGDVTQVLSTEVTATMNLLARGGVMVVATESENRTIGEWDTQADAVANRDIARMLRLREHLIETTEFTADTPIITMGFSNGGSMATAMGTVLAEQALPVAATSVHNNGASRTRPGDFDHPLVVMVTENDTASVNASAIDLANQRIDLGLPALLLEGQEEPLQPERFGRVGGGYADPEVSRATFDELVSLGMIDEDGTRLVPMDEALAALDFYERKAKVGNGPAKVVSQLRVVWQMHRFNSQYNDEECEYLADALADAWGE